MSSVATRIKSCRDLLDQAVGGCDDTKILPIIITPTSSCMHMLVFRELFPWCIQGQNMVMTQPMEVEEPSHRYLVSHAPSTFISNVYAMGT